MGTNFYWYAKPPCPTCGHIEDRTHIGKSSAGWCFSLHVEPHEGINNLGDWIERFERPGSFIRDEYGETLAPQEMLKRITDRTWERDWNRDWHGVLGGYRSEADFHAKNGSERGPNNLLRHRIGAHCVGHGESTYDLIPGEFS